jgi:hypothetical protein
MPSRVERSAWRRWQESPITGEITKETVKTTARGMPGVSGVTVVTTLVCFFISHTRLRAHPAPGIPCASHAGAKGFAEPGCFSAPRDCEVASLFEKSIRLSALSVSPGVGGLAALFLIPPPAKRWGGVGSDEAQRNASRGGGLLSDSICCLTPHPGLRFTSAFPPHRSLTLAGGGIREREGHR